MSKYYSPSAVVTGGLGGADSRYSYGAHYWMSLTTQPYAALYQYANAQSVGIAPVPSGSVPPGMQFWSGRIRNMFSEYDLVQCIRATLTWSEMVPKTQSSVTIINPDPPNVTSAFEFADDRPPAHAFWFPETKYGRDALSASGLVSLLPIDQSSVSSAGSSNVWNAYPQFLNLCQRFSYKFVGGGSVVMHPWASEIDTCGFAITGPTAPTSVAVGQYRMSVDRPARRFVPPITTGSFYTDTSTAALRGVLTMSMFGGWLYFHAPGATASFHNTSYDVAATTTDPPVADTVNLVRTVIPRMIILKRTYVFRFTNPTPRDAGSQKMVIPLTVLGSRIFSLRGTGESELFTTPYYGPLGVSRTGPSGAPAGAVPSAPTEGIVFVDTDGHAPMG